MPTRRNDDDPELPEVTLVAPLATENELSDVEGLLFHLGDELPLVAGLQFRVGAASAREIEILEDLIAQLKKQSGLLDSSPPTTE